MRNGALNAQAGILRALIPEGSSPVNLSFHRTEYREIYDGDNNNKTNEFQRQVPYFNRSPKAPLSPSKIVKVKPILPRINFGLGDQTKVVTKFLLATIYD